MLRKYLTTSLFATVIIFTSLLAQKTQTGLSPMTGSDSDFELHLLDRKPIVERQLHGMFSQVRFFVESSTVSAHGDERIVAEYANEKYLFPAQFNLLLKDATQFADGTDLDILEAFFTLYYYDQNEHFRVVAIEPAVETQKSITYTHQAEFVVNDRLITHRIRMANGFIERSEIIIDGEQQGLITPQNPELLWSINVTGFNLRSEIDKGLWHYYQSVSHNNATTGNCFEFNITGLFPFEENVRIKVRPTWGWGSPWVLDDTLTVGLTGSGTYTWTPPNNDSTALCEVFIERDGMLENANIRVVPEHALSGDFPSGELDYVVYFVEQFFTTRGSQQISARDFANMSTGGLVNIWNTQILDWDLAFGLPNNEPQDGDGLYELIIADDDRSNRYHKMASARARVVNQSDVRISVEENIWDRFPSYSTEELAVEVVMAHEFYHTIQFGLYDHFSGIRVGKWILEGQARALQSVQHPGEEYVVSGLYQEDATVYLLEKQWVPLTQISYEYCLYWRFLYEHLFEGAAEDIKVAVFREASSQCTGSSIASIVSCMDNVLGGFGGKFSNFEESVKEFARNAYLNDPRYGYWNPNPNESFYPRPAINDDSDGDGVTETLSTQKVQTSETAEPYTYGYFVYDIDLDVVEYLLIEMDLDPVNENKPPDMNVQVLLMNGGVVEQEEELHFDGERGHLAIDFELEGSFDRVVIIPLRTDTDLSNNSLYGLTLTPGVEVAFVIDDTEDMENDLIELIPALVDGINSHNHGKNPLVMQLVSFKDDVNEREATIDSLLILSQIQGLSASGGDKCPDGSVEALIEAGSKVIDDGVIMLATNSDPHPSVEFLYEKVIADLAKRGITVHSLVHGTCDEDQPLAASQTEERAETLQTNPSELLVVTTIDTLFENNGFSVEVLLPFDFPFGGVNWSTTWVNADGSISFGRDSFHQPNEIGGFLIDPPRIAPFLSYVDVTGGGTVTVESDSGVFVLRYTKVPHLNGAWEINFSLTLNPDGTFAFDYGMGVNLFQLAIVGYTVGNFVPDPGEIDMTEAVQPIIETGYGTTYEWFGDNDNDLGTLVSYLEFAPVTFPVPVILNAYEASSWVNGATGGLFAYYSDQSGAPLSVYGNYADNMSRGVLNGAIVMAEPLQGVPGSSMTVTLNGIKSEFRTTTAFDFGQGISVNDTEFISPTEMRAMITIDAGANLGYRDVLAITPGVSGESDTTFGSSVFELYKPPSWITKTVASVTPTRLNVGESATVRIEGWNTNFNSNSIVNFGGLDVIVQNINIISSTELEADITVSEGTEIGRALMSVFTGAEFAFGLYSGIFAVQYLPAEQPIVVSMFPETALPGETVAVDISGINTAFTTGVSVVNFSGQDINILNTIVNSPTSLTADVQIGLGAIPGFRDVRVITDGEVASLSAGFKLENIDHPRMGISLATHYFEYVSTCEDSSIMFTINNDSLAAGDLIVSAFEFSGENPEEFYISAGTLPLTIAPGDSHLVGLSFWPDSSGEMSASLAILSNDPVLQDYEISLFGSAFGELRFLGNVTDADSSANSTDALLILSHDVGIAVPEENALLIAAGNGNVNYSSDDTLTNSTDALLILSADAGIAVPFPVGKTFCAPDSGENPSVLTHLSGKANENAVLLVATPEQMNITPGQIVNIPVTVDMTASGESLGSYTMEINWDPLQLELVDVRGGDAKGFESPIINRQTSHKGSLRVAHAAPLGASDAVHVLDLSFRESGSLGQAVVKFRAENLTAAGTFINLLDGMASTESKIALAVESLPTEYQLSNYPNPFNPSTMVQYALPKPGKVEVVIYNVLGQAVFTLAEGHHEAGFYSKPWKGVNDYGQRVSSGVYFMRIQAGSYTGITKMLLMK